MEKEIGNAVANITKNIPTAYLENSDDDSEGESSHVSIESSEHSFTSDNSIDGNNIHEYEWLIKDNLLRSVSKPQ